MQSTETLGHRASPCWISPAHGVFMVNVDASWKRLNGGCHNGVVIRDSASRCLAVRRREIMAPNVLAAEARCILEGCMMAKQGAS